VGKGRGAILAGRGPLRKHEAASVERGPLCSGYHWRPARLQDNRRMRARL